MVSKFNNFRPQLVFAEQSAGFAVVLTTEQKLSLYKKSQKSGISTDVLEEVYRRGYAIWNESFGQTAEQFAFDRVNSFIAGGFAAELDEDLRQWFDPNHPKGGWKRYNSKGEAVGPCARENPGEAKPKCMSNEKAASLSKKERAAAVAAKRRHDPNPERKGKPINVSNFGKGKISEMTDITEENKPTNPALWSKAKSLAKQKFDVYPSAYANGWAAKWYKSKGGGWKSVSEEVVDEDCWKGYKRVGMKKKGERMVPNCVPVKESQDEDLKKVTDIAAKLKDMSKETIKPTVKKLPHVNDPGTPEMFKIKESKETAERQSKNSNDPSSRFDGTKSLVRVYKKETPGQMKESVLPTIKRIVAEATYKGRKVSLNKPFRTPGGPKKSAVYVDPDGDGKAKIVRFGDPNLSIKKNQPGRKKSYCARSGGQGNLTKKDSANYWSRRAWDC